MIECEIYYFYSPHLIQIYEGFYRLAKKKVIKLKIKKLKKDPRKPVLEVIIDKKYKCIYDTLDGFNWIDAPLEENLEFFKKRFIGIDYYFKRSFFGNLI